MQGNIRVGVCFQRSHRMNGVRYRIGDRAEMNILEASSLLEARIAQLVFTDCAEMRRVHSEIYRQVVSGTLLWSEEVPLGRVLVRIEAMAGGQPAGLIPTRSREVSR